MTRKKAQEARRRVAIVVLGVAPACRYDADFMPQEYVHFEVEFLSMGHEVGEYGIVGGVVPGPVLEIA